MGEKTASRQAGVTRASGLTWLGFGIVALGWALLIAGLMVSDATLRAGNLVTTMAARADIVTVAQTAIVTGLGLAVVGSLRTGFGAFGRFFDAVLQRSASRPAAAPEPMAPTVVVPAAERGAATAPKAPPTLRTRDKNYVVLPDGSVEVETMFGTRVFATFDEAREFIR